MAFSGLSLNMVKPSDFLEDQSTFHQLTKAVIVTVELLFVRLRTGVMNR